MLGSRFELIYWMTLPGGCFTSIFFFAWIFFSANGWCHLLGLFFVHSTLGVVVRLHKSVESVGDASHFIGPSRDVDLHSCVCVFHLEIPEIEKVPFFAHRSILHDFSWTSVIFGWQTRRGRHGKIGICFWIGWVAAEWDLQFSSNFNCSARRHFNSISRQLWDLSDKITFRKLRLIFFKFSACAAAWWDLFSCFCNWRRINRTNGIPNNSGRNWENFKIELNRELMWKEFSYQRNKSKTNVETWKTMKWKEINRFGVFRSTLISLYLRFLSYFWQKWLGCVSII